MSLTVFSPVRAEYVCRHKEFGTQPSVPQPLPLGELLCSIRAYKGNIFLRRKWVVVRLRPLRPAYTPPVLFSLSPPPIRFVLVSVLCLSAGSAAFTIAFPAAESRSDQKQRISIRSPWSHASPPSVRPAFDTLHTVNALVVKYTNETRRDRGLSPLQKEPGLEAVGCAHSADMFRRAFFEHENPDGESPQDRVSRMHRRLVGGVSENLYEQTGLRKDTVSLARRIVDHWMESPPHRRNLLSHKPTHVGVCALRRDTTILATQLFARVVAYIQPEIPRTLPPGSALHISTHPPGFVNATVAKYDLWDPQVHRRVTAPSIIGDSLHFPDTTGTFRTRFYVVENGTYVLRHGPDVVLSTSP